MKPVLVIQNCDIESPGSVIDYLTDRKIPFTRIRSYLQPSFLAVSDISAAIVLGCPESVRNYREHPYLRALYEFVAVATRQNLPYLGICFGGQILAKVPGAEVNPNPVKEIGTYDVRLTEAGKKDSLFAGFDDIFTVFQWHGDTFKVPFGANLLVEGNDCRNQAFRRGNLVGLQFHLETPLEEVSIWCDRYSHELIEVDKAEDTIIAGYRRHAATTKSLNYRLLDNFFDVVAT